MSAHRMALAEPGSHPTATKAPRRYSASMNPFRPLAGLTGGAARANEDEDR